MIGENVILSNVLQFVGDNDLKKGLSLGWYKSRLQSSIEQLSIATFYDVITQDFDFDHHRLQLELPKNCFNIREVYVWRGECCSPQYSAIVHYKRLMNNKPNGGREYTSLRKDNGGQAHDAFYKNQGHIVNGGHGNRHGNVKFAGVQNGLLMFSSNCSSYNKVRLVYNGFGGEIGDPPLVPRLLRQVVEDMVICDVFRALMARERTYASLYKEYDNKLYNERTGTFWQSKKNISALDSWSRQDYETYQDRGNF